MENEFQKMQRLAGVPVTEDKKSLNENFVGLPMVGNIFDRPKADYELAYEHYLGNVNEVEEGKIEEGAFGDLLSRMEKNTRLTADILTVAKLAKEDKEGNADKAVQLMMNNHNMSEEEAVEAVTRIFKKAFEWVDSNELNEVEGMGGENPIDAISMDVPLFIRMLEFAREDASTDMDLHDVAEKAIAMSAEGKVLSMDNYEDLVGGEAETEELNEGEGKFFVYTNNTPEGKYIKIAKTLAKNLTRDEAKDFIEKNQSKYKAPLSYTEDRRDMFDINADDEEFPTSY